MPKRKRNPLVPEGIAFSPPSDLAGWPTWIYDAAFAHDLQDTELDLMAGARHALALARHARYPGHTLTNPMTGEPVAPTEPPDSGPGHDACMLLREFADAGKILVLDQHSEVVDGERGPEIDFYFGERFPEELLPATAWQAPQAGHLNFTTGQVIVTCGDGLYEDGRSTIALPVGGFAVYAYHRNADAMMESGADRHYDGPDHVLHFCPLIGHDRPVIDVPVLYCG